MGNSASNAAVPFVTPALLRCDGIYAIDGFDGGSFRPGWTELAVELTNFGGCIRFEGNGGCLLLRNKGETEHIRGEWTVLSERVVRIDLSTVEANVHPALIIQEGPKDNTILISKEGSSLDGGVCRYAFTPDEVRTERNDAALQALDVLTQNVPLQEERQ